MRFLLLAAALVLGACATPAPYDYSAFQAHRPRSLLVLPPLDDSMEVDATYAYLSTVTEPLAERGYYVFPVAVVDRLLRDNGLSGPSEMRQAPLDRIRDVFGADAVLYITLKDWGTAYRVIDSSTEVTIEAHLVDVASGTELWSGEHSELVSSSSGQTSLFGLLVSAVTNQLTTSASDPSTDVARSCNHELFWNDHHGLPLGLHNPGYVGGP